MAGAHYRIRARDKTAVGPGDDVVEIHCGSDVWSWVSNKYLEPAIRRIAELEEERERNDIDALLRRVVQRINNGFDLTIYGDKGGVAMIEGNWCRDYGPAVGESDGRPLSQGTALADVLRWIIQYEDEADARDAGENGP